MRIRYLVMFIVVFVVSCSATRLGNKTTIQHDTLKRATEKIQSVPLNTLTPEEKVAGKEAQQTIQEGAKTVTKPNPLNSDLIEAIAKSNEMVAELYTESVEARKKSDSLETENRYLALLLQRQYKTLDNIDKTIGDEAKAGRVLIKTFRTVPAILGAILLTLIFIAGLLWLEQKRLNKEKKILSGNNG